MKPEVLLDEPTRLWIRRRDGGFAEYHPESWDILKDSEDEAREGLLDCLRTERYDDPDIYWQVGPGERYLQSSDEFGWGFERRHTDDPAGPGQRIGWTFWCTPRLREYRPDAHGLRTRPRRLT